MMKTWLYLPNGCKYEFSRDILTKEDAIWAADNDYAAAMEYTSRLLALGASVAAPGLEAGEQKSDIGYLARWLKNDNDGGTSNRVDLYVNHPKMLSRFMSIYVKNTPEDNAEFAAITGVNLNGVPNLPTKAPMNKEEDRNGCIVALPKPLNVIWKHNPNYREGVLDGEPARLFVRWDNVGNPTPLPALPPAPQSNKTGANSSAPPTAASVTAATAENAGNGDIYAGHPSWFRTPVRDCFGAVKTYILKEVYSNNTYAMNGSLDKRGLTVKGRFDDQGEWSGKSAGELIDFLKHRHDEDEKLTA